MKEKIALVSILANFVLAFTKILMGYFSASASVLAEGFHSLSDIFSSLIGYTGIKISQKKADKKHPYGHYKFEVLSAVIITLILFATGIGVIYDAYKNYTDPTQVEINYLLIGVMVLSVLINFATSKIKIYYGKKENSLTLLSDGSHDKADVLTSIVVLLGLFLYKYFNHIDSLLAVIIGIYIIKESFSLGKEASDSLLDVAADEEIETKIKLIIEDEKIKLNSLKTQKKGSAITANLEIELPSLIKVDEATKISENLKNKLTEKINNLAYVVIQIKSHDTQTHYFKPNFGKSLSWERRGKNNEKDGGKGPEGICFCPKCDYEIKHQRGIPCHEMICPSCKTRLERK
jgi:cation diffusion facilitator family transporter